MNTLRSHVGRTNIVATMAFASAFGSGLSWEPKTASAQVMSSGEAIIRSSLESAFNGMDRHYRHTIQSELKYLDLYDGEIDTLWGQGTYEGLVGFARLIDGDPDSLSSSAAARDLLMALLDGSEEGAECDGCGGAAYASGTPSAAPAPAAPKPASTGKATFSTRGFSCNKQPFDFVAWMQSGDLVEMTSGDIMNAARELIGKRTYDEHDISMVYQLRRLSNGNPIADYVYGQAMAQQGDLQSAGDAFLNSAAQGNMYAAAVIPDLVAGKGAFEGQSALTVKRDVVFDCLALAFEKAADNAYVAEVSLKGVRDYLGMMTGASFMPSFLHMKDEFDPVRADQAWSYLSNRGGLQGWQGAGEVRDYIDAQKASLTATAAAASEDLDALCEGSVSLRGVCWAQNRQQQATALRGRGFSCSDVGNTTQCGRNGEMEALIESDVVSFTCSALGICDYGVEEVAQMMVDQGIVNEMVPDFEMVNGMAITNYCHRGERGEELCVEQMEAMETGQRMIKARLIKSAYGKGANGSSGVSFN